ncbi:DUF4956 domain-containing protein [uncultured Desulfovibrio sp.]|uniref:DUF4956 domain-containing protein n=1 Tax=uncultured Desulfovibrio sp. TaxID=167968 RepID=UPI002604D020|nr:DUF4956 domain-containing protein [uncultured Desulfovibrio sp.]
MTDELQKILLMLSRQEALSLPSLALTMAVALGCGLAIYLIYRIFFRGVVYSENFGVLLLIVSGITAFIITTIGTNIILTLGMVGALSIVRFRAPIKDPLDVGFLYWSIAAGLASGARLYMVAVFGTALIGLAYIVMTLARKDRRVYLLILSYAQQDEEAVAQLLRPLKGKLKNKSVSGGRTELTLEIKARGGHTDFMNSLNDARIEKATLVEYNGNYA